MARVPVKCPPKAFHSHEIVTQATKQIECELTGKQIGREDPRFGPSPRSLSEMN